MIILSSSTSFLPSSAFLSFLFLFLLRTIELERLKYPYSVGGNEEWEEQRKKEAKHQVVGLLKKKKEMIFRYMNNKNIIIYNK
jgi:hypothetical protein